MYSPDLKLDELAEKCCSHPPGYHKQLVGKDTDGEWLTGKAASYPTLLCKAMAASLPKIHGRIGHLEPVRKSVTLAATASQTQSAEDSQTQAGANHTNETQVSPLHLLANTAAAVMNNDNNETQSESAATVTTVIANQGSGPRPDGGHFQLRSNKSYAGNSGVYNRSSGDVCAIVPNSNTGRALQAITVAPDNVSPKGRKTAMKMNREGWLKAEEKELASHERNQSWSVIPAHQVEAGRRILRMLWVYKIKRDGTLKARLCVMGSAQRPGVDFDQTYCATMRSTSLRLLAAISAANNLSMWRIDFVSAYLQGKLEEGETVFCKMPEGYETTNSDGRPNVLRLEKPIYGLAQAGRRFQRSIFPWLKQFGFKQSEYDPCVFFMRTHNADRNELVILGVYVDDILTCASHTDKQSTVRKFVAALKSEWEVEEEGDAVDLLNVHFKRTQNGILLHQRPYIESLTDRYAPDGVPLAFQRNSAPCAANIAELIREAMSSSIEPEPAVVKSYQSIVGALLYCATNTRPDIAYSVGMLCRAMSRPNQQLYDAAMRVLYYLARHADVGLFYEADPTDICAYSDSDLGTQYSTTGWDVHWQKASISFGSKKQISVATSSCHAEIIAASETAKEAKYFSEFTTELGFPPKEPMPVYVDNQAAIDLSYNPEFHSRTKHIDRRHFYIRELVEDHVVRVQYVNTAENLADFFTKPLPPKTFFKLRDRIMNIHSEHGRAA